MLSRCQLHAEVIRKQITEHVTQQYFYFERRHRVLQKLMDVYINRDVATVHDCDFKIVRIILFPVLMIIFMCRFVEESRQLSVDERTFIVENR